MVKSIEIVSPTGTIKLRDDATNYLRTTGGSGWGKAPVANKFTESALDGAIFRGSRATARTYTLPAYVFADNPQTLNNLIRDLVKALKTQTTLKITDHNNQTWTIPIVYETGLEGTYTHGNALAEFKSITFKCPDPYWTSTSVKTEEWVNAVSEPFLERRVLSASSLTGDRIITNDSDVPSRPTWRIDGPCTSFSVSVNGTGFSFDGSLLLGEHIDVFFDGWAWRVVDGATANRYADIGFAPKFPEIPAGESTVSLDLEGADEGTRVTVFWPQRREVMF